MGKETLHIKYNIYNKTRGLKMPQKAGCTGSNTISDWCNCIPGRKSGILRIQYGHAAADAEVSFWMR